MPMSLTPDLAAAQAAAAQATAALPYAIVADAGQANATRNLLDPARVTEGYAVSRLDGTLIATAGYFASDYIPVAPGQQLVSNTAMGANATLGWAFYDVARAFVSGGTNTSTAAGTPIAVPAGAAYVRCHFNASPAVDSNVYLGIGAALPAVKPAFGSVDPLAAFANFLSRQIEVADATVNLFDKTRVQAGKSLSNADALAANAGFYVTDYIPVLRGGSITIAKATGASAGFGVVFYNLAKKLVSFQNAPIAAGQNIAVPDQAAYCRFCSANSTLHSQMVVIGATLPTTYRPFNASPATAAMVAATLPFLAPVGVNLYDPDRRSVGLLKTADGLVDATQTDYFTTDYLPVLGASQIVHSGLTGVTVATWGLAFYGSDHSLISAVGGNATTAGTPVAVPDGACWVRACANVSAAEFFHLSQGAALPALRGGFPMRAALKAKAWAGQGMAVFGDSITAANVWQQAAAGYLNATLAYNGGLNGAKMADRVAVVTAGNLANAALSVVALGTNDYYYATALGALGDATGAGTFYGNCRAIIEAHFTAKPGIRLAFFTPLYRSDAAVANAVGLKTKDYADAIIAICGEYGLPVLDLFRQCGINTLNQATFLSDGVHPIVSAGYAIFQNRINKFLESV